ncbi:hypothetical protein IEN85_10800 [Pelagicoccus sp. NFK12]|uniref:Uncharacterized protein n=1 Tax=Pelagicoccus enzymogenes TaxID=2773457 RepID=A0A927F816_9BACT|nr:hypothetical protein [Pelagicoccus enzymogenes]MBD5779977.1 hypothetical protein [Pelagicoccus enzymogenes]
MYFVLSSYAFAGSGDTGISLSLRFEAEIAKIQWANNSDKKLSYYHNQLTSNGVQYHGYQLYLIDEENEVTKVYFVGESNASVPEFSELEPSEVETTEIDLHAWFKHNEDYEIPRPEDGRYIAFIKYDDFEQDGVYDFASLGTLFTSITTLEIANGRIKN